MDKKITKKKMIKRIVDRLDDTRIVIGGHKYFYKRKYHLQYTQKIVQNVLDAFFAEICKVIAEGNTVQFQGYLTIEPVIRKEHIRRNPKTDEKVMVPEEYRVKIKRGAYLDKACEILSNRELKMNEKQDEACEEIE